MLSEVLLALSFILLSSAEISTVQKPNIIFILADDLGYGDVSFHGSSQIPTPYLDALAYDGIILSNYYVQPICTPTRSAIMTARYPIHTGMQHGVIMAGEPWGLGLDEKIMPQYLHDAGYQSHIVGKWHLGSHAWDYAPTYRGFLDHYGYLQGASDYYKHVYTDGGKRTEGLDFWDNKSLVRNETGYYSTELYSHRAQRIIREHDTTKPLFMYMAHQAVHSAVGGDPLEAPKRYINKFRHIKNKQRRIFAAMVSVMDDAVGALVAALVDKDMLRNTIIVFSTDNGGPAAGFNSNMASNAPLRGVKHTLWEGGTRGTGFIWSPLLKNHGYISKHMMHCTDWLPTLLSAVNHPITPPPSHPLDGVDMWKTLSEKQPESPRKEILLNIDPATKIETSAIRQGDMKLISGEGKQWDGWYPTPQEEEEIDVQMEVDKFGINFDHHENIATFTQFTAEMDIMNFPGVTKSKFYLQRSNSMKALLEKIGRNVSADNEKPLKVKCGPKPANATTNCNSTMTPCLYNITSDPCEYNNVAHLYPNVVKQLQDRLNFYSKSMVKPRNEPFDPKSLPQYHDGAWVPWVSDQ